MACSSPTEAGLDRLIPSTQGSSRRESKVDFDYSLNQSCDKKCLNQIVEDFLNSNPSRKDNSKAKSKMLDKATKIKESKNRKIRKTSMTYRTLYHHYHKEPNWSRDLINRLALELNLSP